MELESKLKLESARLDPFLKGIKAGAAKRSIDKLTLKISDPVAEMITARIQEDYPQFCFAIPTVKNLVQAMIIMGVAELFGVAGKLSDSSEGIKDKMAGLENFLRVYAGQKTGEELVDIISKSIPFLLESFSDISTEDIKLLSQVDSEFSVPLLKEEESLCPK